ncbi:YeeE/YedE thiosulfate transporter family protein [Anaeromyxobacter terrae]|uniref:YeeE/YedE thiosulfate transporter family protein n=1 Tax=Anaeromyxobacter terrae TaxID=2925406 RepID=UPI001F5998A5|nr:YeeE/YedE thiosulfate transporter family protein [Anaeromyxobacter sp. SG22]
MQRNPDKFWNPYLAGVALGLVLLTSFLVMGSGLGASGASLRAGIAALDLFAPGHVASTPPLARAAASPHVTWLVFEIFGALLGGVVAAYTSGRLRGEVLKGPRIGNGARLALALLGGVLMGAAAKMTRGCTSGQALSGGALLSVGAWAFMFSVFGGGYALAWFVRREWR